MIIYNAFINGKDFGWIEIEAPFIKKIGYGNLPEQYFESNKEIIDAQGAMLLPGVIDCHVHFREPGLTHKANIYSESRAAIAGGVTSFIEMPNTIPQTTTIEAWHEKMDIASQNSAANYAFMLGATNDNIDEIRKADSSQMPAVKVFMGSSTGNMLLDDEYYLRKIFAEQPFKVVVHAEDQSIINRLTEQYKDSKDISYHSLIRSAEACVRATERAMNMAVRYGTNLHIAHVSTEAETKLFDASTTPERKQITAEVSPHHLIFTTEDYAELGAKIKMNPSVKTLRDRQALRAALEAGKIDIIATDHAPHLLSEKEGDVFHAVSGAPMVQYSLPAMLDLFDVDTVVKRMSNSPAILYNIDRRGFIREGYYADLVLVKKTEEYVIEKSDIKSLCGWSPLEGKKLGHKVLYTLVNGGNPAMPLSFKQGVNKV